MALPQALSQAQSAWLLQHTLDCCERPLAPDEAAEFLVARSPDGPWIAYVHPGHDPVRWRPLARWRVDRYPGAVLRRVPARPQRWPPCEAPADV